MFTTLLILIVVTYISQIIGWEYKATFHLKKPADSTKDYAIFTFNLGLKNGAYADPYMNIYMQKVAAHGAAGVREANPYAVAAETEDANSTGTSTTPIGAGTLTEIPSNGVLGIRRLVFNQESWVSLFHFNITGSGSDLGDYAVFGQHGPSEFSPVGDDIKFSFVHDEKGNVVPPEYVEGQTTVDPDKPWSETMGASFAVWVVTFTGLCLLVIPDFTKYFTEKHDVTFYIAMFASGIFLSTAFCLILFEATHLIMAETKDESIAIGEWSSMILLGFMLTPILHLIKDVIIGDEELIGGSDLPTIKDGAKASEVMTVSERSKLSLLTGILIGDFFHNFCDGIFIGTAFKLCSNDIAWSISAATIAHEIPQEVSDFALMVSPKIGFSIPWALFVNAASGFSVIIGAIIATAIDIGNRDVGMLLAFGGGTYLYLGTVELFDVETNYSVMTRCVGTLIFMIGAIAIGLVLLDHEHCDGEADSGSDGGAHAGHAH